jgi:hypothetical protein
MSRLMSYGNVFAVLMLKVFSQNINESLIFSFNEYLMSTYYVL